MNYGFILLMYVPCLQTTDISHRSKPKTPVIVSPPRKPCNPPTCLSPCPAQALRVFLQGLSGTGTHSLCFVGTGSGQGFSVCSWQQKEAGEQNGRVSTHPCAKILMLTIFPTSNTFNAFQCLSSWTRYLLKGPWAPETLWRLNLLGKKEEKWFWA